ncbi:MAG: LysM peptidoglycan-binding domain-containing protein [Anaerolineae bacterium]|nr:LysM peptidoglycan-binding domain-containing protein [Anaerolineae bacterium]
MKKFSLELRKFGFVLAVGLLLMMGVTAVNAAPAAETTSQQFTGFYYTVQWGDSLSQIAVRYGTTMQAIMLANPWVVNPNLIYAGTPLFIPTGAPGVIQPPGGGNPAPTPPPAPSNCRYYHTVAWGQNLIQIGGIYGVSPFAIAEANQIFDLNRIFAGQVLCIP